MFRDKERVLTQELKSIYGEKVGCRKVARVELIRYFGHSVEKVTWLFVQ